MLGHIESRNIVTVSTLFVGCAGLVGLVAGMGRRARQAEAQRELAARDERLRRIELGLTRDRAALSRDVHDLVGHTLTAIVNLSDGAAAAFDRDPRLAREGVWRINEIAREGLAETRAVLDALRQDRDEGMRGPAAHPDRIPQLLEPARAAGIRAELSERGDPGACQLDVSVAAAAYRITQEAITNALRHADGARFIRVDLCWSADGLELSVQNDGAARRAVAAEASVLGRGISGMRERAELAGGTLRAGPGEGNGWVVRAWLPARPPVVDEACAQPGDAPGGAVARGAGVEASGAVRVREDGAGAGAARAASGVLGPVEDSAARAALPARRPVAGDGSGSAAAHGVGGAGADAFDPVRLAESGASAGGAGASGRVASVEAANGAAGREERTS